MTTPEDNQQTVTAYVATFNRGDWGIMPGLFTPDAIIHGVLGWGGLERVLPIWRDLHAAFAIHLDVANMIVEGDQVAVRYVERGKSVGPWRGQPATGKSYELVAMEWFELRGGKISCRWGARDSAAQFRQMGLAVV
jgi:predicted ester cyclase